MNDILTTGTDLAVLPVAQFPVILAADDKDILGKLKAELENWEADVSTAKGRAEIRSKRQKVRIARADFKRLADALKEGAIKTQRDVNAEFKILDGRMEALIASVGAELDAIEAAEEAERKANEDAITGLEMLVEGAADMASEQIAARLESIQPFDWSIEFRTRGERVKSGVIAQLRLAHQAAVTREDDAAALAAREAEEAEQRRLAEIEARRQREEQIARDAAEAARKTAEAEAERLRVEAEERAQAQLRAAEALRRHQAEEAAAALERAEREKQEAIVKAERDRRAQEARAAQAALDAERAAKAAEEKAERDRAAAVKAEQDRVARESAALKAEEDRRAADTKHRAQINREVVADLIERVTHQLGVPLSEVNARAIVVAVAKGEIRHTRITY